MVQGAPLAVPEDPGKVEDPRLARGQEFLAGELRGGVEVEGCGPAAQGLGLGGEGVQVGFVAGRDLQGGGLDLGEAILLEPAADRPADASSGLQARSPVGPARGSRTAPEKALCVAAAHG